MATPNPTALLQQMVALAQNYQNVRQGMSSVAAMINAESTLAADLASAAASQGKTLVTANFNDFAVYVGLLNTLDATTTGNNVSVVQNTGGQAALAVNRMLYL